MVSFFRNTTNFVICEYKTALQESPQLQVYSQHRGSYGCVSMCSSYIQHMFQIAAGDDGSRGKRPRDKKTDDIVSKML